MRRSTLPSIGAAWTSMAAELESELRQDDPAVRVQAVIDSSGLPRFRVISEVIRREDAGRAARRWEWKATTTCENCGQLVDTMRFTGRGVMTIRCPACAAR
jgi:hypothetical protein